MERVVFYIESTGQSVRCLLNPEGLTLQRLSGLQERTSEGRPIAHHSMSDAPLINTGAGSTTIELKIMFDVTISQRVITDVRTLSKPLWDLAENHQVKSEYTQPPIVRLVWGKTWNLPGIITAAAEKFESFDHDGIPKRSWMTLHFRRLSESSASSKKPQKDTTQNSNITVNLTAANKIDNIELVPGARLDLLAEKYLGDSRKWRSIAQLNQINDPSNVTSSQMIKVPSSGSTS